MKNAIYKSSLGLKSLPKIARQTLRGRHPNNPTVLAAGARVKDKVFLLQSPFSRTYCPHKILLDHKIFHLLYSSNDLKIEISLTVLSNIREVCLKENHLVKGCEIILEIVAVKKVPKNFISIYNIHKHSQICILIFVYQKFF